MKRREFITLLGGAAAATWSLRPLAARAQQASRLRRIGVLTSYAENDPQAQGWIAILRQELRKLGWGEGQNYQIEFRWAATDLERMQRFAKELVEWRPELLLAASSTPATKALVQQTRSIPIVFINIVDPVGSGFVASLPRPGGNATGFVNLEASITGKYVGLLKEIAPRVARIAIFFNPTTAPYFQIYLDPFKAAVAHYGVEPIVAQVRDMAELEAVMAAQAREPNGGLIAMPDASNTAHGAEIAALAARYRLPLVHNSRSVAVAGGLVSYGNDGGDNYRRAAAYVDRILKGENPGDLPVQFPVKFELVINLKTAKTLGLTVPPSVLATADEVIE
jgi:putative ABC transport system substrate-binding protein